MPYKATSVSSRHKGWHHDQINGRLAAVFNGTEAFDFDANDLAVDVAATFATTITQTTGNLVNSAGDLRATVGNLRLGTVSNFATTQPLAWAVFRSSTQPAGAITTAGGVGANDTTVQKIIAAGTINNVET